MHTEGRQDEYLVGFEQEQLIVHAHKFTAPDMDIELKIIMAVELRDLKGFADLVVGLISLMALLPHGQERSLGHIRLTGSHAFSSCFGLCRICIH